MSKIEMLRLLITQRLTEAAEEIFGVFGRTIAEYEEEISRSKLEIDRQRRLLELSRQPQVSLQLSGSAVCEPPEWSDLKPPIKEEEQEEQEQEEQEEEELWSAQEEAEPSDISFLLFRRGGARHDPDGERAASSLSCRDDSEPDPRPGPSARRGGADPDRDAAEASEPAAGNGRADGEPEAAPSEAVDSYICTVCGRAFAQRGHWAKHAQVHRRNDAKADKSFTCDICGKRLTRFDGYQKHLRIHTGEKPYSCSHCGRRFSDNSNYKRHVRTHAAPTS